MGDAVKIPNGMADNTRFLLMKRDSRKLAKYPVKSLSIRALVNSFAHNSLKGDKALHDINLSHAKNKKNTFFHKTKCNNT